MPITNQALRANAALKEIREIHRDHAEGHYRTAEILHTFWIDEEYLTLGFKSWRQFLEQATLPISSYHMRQYVILFENFCYHDYKKKQALEMLSIASVSSINRVMGSEKKKLKPRDIVERNKEYYRTHPQIGFTLDPSDLQEIIPILESYGLTYTPTGRRLNSREALVAVIRKAGYNTRQNKKSA